MPCKKQDVKVHKYFASFCALFYIHGKKFEIFENEAWIPTKKGNMLDYLTKAYWSKTFKINKHNALADDGIDLKCKAPNMQQTS